MNILEWGKQNIKFVGNVNTNKSSRRGCIPQIIVNHISEGSMSSMINWFTSPNNNQSSAHFGVSKKGEIYQFVAVEDAAWANGLTSGIENTTAELVRQKGKDINPNWYSVSIEHEGIYKETKGILTSAQLEATEMLHKYIIEYVKQKYDHTIQSSRKTIIGHYEIDKKQRPNCPGQLFPFDDIIRFLAEPYQDIKGHWAESLIRQAIAEGWVKGYPDGTFQPDKPLTRAEAIVLIITAIKKAPG